MLSGDSDRRVRFDTFEADLRSGALKDGVRVKLTEQPFSVLAMLLTRPGDMVTRDELRKALWPADTFVDFDRGLNKAINRLAMPWAIPPTRRAISKRCRNAAIASSPRWRWPPTSVHRCRA